MANRRLEGKVAVITDVCDLTGSTVAAKFAAEGAKVAFFGTDDEWGRKTLERIKELGGEGFFANVDIRDKSAVTSFVNDAEAKFGDVTSLVCMHSIPESGKSFEEMDEDDWNLYMERDGLGPIFAFEACIGTFRKNHYGTFTKITSRNGGKQPDVCVAFDAYFSAGWRILIEGASMEWAPWNIRCNAIEKGIIDDGTREWTKEDIYTYQSPDGLRRPGTPEELANLIVFVASDEASFITGANLVCNGGNVSRNFERDSWNVGETEFLREFEGGTDAGVGGK